MSEYRSLVKKDGDKYRVFYSYISPKDGKRHRTCKRGFKLKKDADKWVKYDLPNIIKQLEHVETLDENLTMGELVEKYKQHIQNGCTASYCRKGSVTCFYKVGVIDICCKHLGGICYVVAYNYTVNGIVKLLGDISYKHGDCKNCDTFPRRT